MEIVLGSDNRAKVRAVETVFVGVQLTSLNVASDVATQPIGDEETLSGAINRARNAQKIHPNSVALGLEGGVMFLHDQLYLNNWGALITPKGDVYTSAGARIPLPDSFIEQINAGIELSDVMNAYTKRNDIRHKEGAIGIFTASHISRAEMFAHVVTLLKGQMEYGGGK